jgi:hypothetical protein
MLIKVGFAYDIHRVECVYILSVWIVLRNDKNRRKEKNKQASRPAANYTVVVAHGPWISVSRTCMSSVHRRMTATYGSTVQVPIPSHQLKQGPSIASNRHLRIYHSTCNPPRCINTRLSSIGRSQISIGCYFQAAIITCFINEAILLMIDHT